MQSFRPNLKLLVLAIQHVLVLYTGNVAVPLLVAHALQLPSEQTASLINADLFAAGIATLIQTLFSARLPLMMGATFLSVAPAIAMGLDPNVGLRGFYGAVIVSGIVGIVMAPAMGKAAALFPSLVSGCVITLIGLSLLSVAFNWVGGGPLGSEHYGSPRRLSLALFVFATTLLFTRFGSGLFRTLAVLLAIVSGSLLSFALGEFHVPGLAASPWIGLVLPLQFGRPVFQIVPILTMSLVMLITLVESTGVIFALGRITGIEPSRSTLTKSLRGDGFGILAGGLFNAFPYTSFSQNVGLIGITGVSSRFVCATAGGILLLLGLLPKLAHIVAAVPQSVLGGAGIVMFGMVTATGIQVLSEANFAATSYNQLIVASSIGIGLIPTLAPQLLQHLPAWATPVTKSGVIMGTLVAIALNLFFHGLPPAESAENA